MFCSELKQTIISLMCGLVNLAEALEGIKVRINLSAQEILNLADSIIASSKGVHDAVAAVPLDQVRPGAIRLAHWVQCWLQLLASIVFLSMCSLGLRRTKVLDYMHECHA